MNKKNQHVVRRTKIKRKQRINTLVWGGVAVVVVGIIGFTIRNAVQPLQGEAVPIMDNYEAHISEGTDPGPFNSNPPSSGPHYGQEYDAGFYEASSPEAQVPFPEGYLGHNLEHGYVIYWYNCDLLAIDQCTELKAQIKTSMADNGQTKLIAFPWASLDTAVAMTSWGQLLKMETFDAGQAKSFVNVNRNKAPEPNAP